MKFTRPKFALPAPGLIMERADWNGYFAWISTGLPAVFPGACGQTVLSNVGEMQVEAGLQLMDPVLETNVKFS